VASDPQQKEPGNTALSTAAADVPPGQINYFNLVWSALAIVAMIAVILWGNLHALNFLHVGAGLLWTGIDLFMGFVIGPVLRSVPFEIRRAVMTRLTPRTIFILPVLAIITGTSGWYLAKQMGYLDLDYPAFWWVVAALVIMTILTIQGIGILLPTQIRVYREMVKPQPDVARVIALSRWYFWLVASQGVMQVAIIVIMTKFRAGL
jgi:hypothetical protein